MRKFLSIILTLLVSLGLTAQTGGVSTSIRSGPSLPTNASINSLFTVNGVGMYKCNANPCTVVTNWTKIAEVNSAGNLTVTTLTANNVAISCPNVVNDGVTDNTTALNACSSTGKKYTFPTVCQGSNGAILYSGAITLTSGTEFGGGGWGTISPCPTVFNNTSTTADSFDINCSSASPTHCLTVSLHDMNIIAQTASTGTGIHLTGTGGDSGTTYHGDLVLLDHLLITGHKQPVYSAGYGNGIIGTIQVYPTTASTGIYLVDIGSGSANSWRINKILGSCNVYGGTVGIATGVLRFRDGVGSSGYVGDADYCVNPVSMGVSSTDYGSADLTIGDAEMTTGAFGNVQYGSTASIHFMGSQGLPSNTTQSAFVMNGLGSLTLYSTPWASAIATNYPTTGAVTTATTGGTLAASTTYYYRVAATNVSGTTLASPEVSITTGSGTATNTVTVTWSVLQGVQAYQVFGRTTGAEQLIATVNGMQSTSYTDTGSITPSGTLPTTATLMYPLVAKLASTDDVSVIGQFPVGAGMSMKNMATDANGETYVPYDHCQELPDNSIPTASAYNRLACYKIAARTSAAVVDGVYYSYRNAAQNYVLTGNLLTALSANIQLNDSISGAQLFISQAGVGTNAGLLTLATTNASTLAYDLNLTTAGTTSSQYLIRMQDGNSGTAWGFTAGQITLPHNTLFQTLTSATSSNNYNSPKTYWQGSGWSGSAAVGSSFTLAAYYASGSEPATTFTLGYNPGSLTGAAYVDFTAATGGFKAVGLTATAAAVTVSTGQIGYGGTTAAASSCGSLTSALGCVVINVAGTNHYIPYY